MHSTIKYLRTSNIIILLFLLLMYPHTIMLCACKGAQSTHLCLVYTDVCMYRKCGDVYLHECIFGAMYRVALVLLQVM